MTPREKLTAARLRLNLDHPFYATLMFKQKLVLDHPSTKTMAVDGTSLFVNLDFVDKHPRDEIVGVLIHEMEHLARFHVTRRNGRDARLFNIACDAVINAELVAMGIKLPAKRVDLPWAKGLSAEEVYERLKKEQKEQRIQPSKGEGEGEGEGEGGFGADDIREPANGGDNGEKTHTEIEVEISTTVHQAAMNARFKNQGKLPSHVQRILDEMAKPRVRWQDWIVDQVYAANPSAQSWSRPHRRVPGMSPGWIKTGIGPIIIYQDTSGSMSAHELAYSRAEVLSLLESLRPEAVHFLACDANVHSHVEIGPDDDLDVASFVGGGGSDFRPAFAYAEQNISDATLAIVLSDMMISFPDDPPPYPVIGVSTTQYSGPEWMNTIQRERMP